MMFSFWAILIGASWVIAKSYLPFLRSLLGALFEMLLVDVLVWLAVLLVLGLILLLYRRFLYALFKREIGKS